MVRKTVTKTNKQTNAHTHTQKRKLKGTISRNILRAIPPAPKTISWYLKQQHFEVKRYFQVDIFKGCRLQILVTRTYRGDLNGTLKLKDEEDERQDGITVIQRR